MPHSLMTDLDAEKVMLNTLAALVSQDLFKSCFDESRLVLELACRRRQVLKAQEQQGHLPKSPCSFAHVTSLF